MNKFVNITAYKFVTLTDVRLLRTRLLTLCKSRELKGTILLSHEGINLCVAGAPDGIDCLLAELRSWPGLGELQPKFSEADHARMQELMDKSNEGVLTPDETAELDGYVNIANVLSVMHSQARLALTKPAFETLRDARNS